MNCRCDEMDSIRYSTHKLVGKMWGQYYTSEIPLIVWNIAYILRVLENERGNPSFAVIAENAKNVSKITSIVGTSRHFINKGLLFVITHSLSFFTSTKMFSPEADLFFKSSTIMIQKLLHYGLLSAFMNHKQCFLFIFFCKILDAQRESFPSLRCKNVKMGRGAQNVITKQTLSFLKAKPNAYRSRVASREAARHTTGTLYVYLYFFLFRLLNKF